MTRIFIALAVILAFIFPYTVGWELSWWKFVPSTVVIIILMRLARPQTWASDLGLRFGVSDCGLAALFFIAVYFCGNWFIGNLLGAHGFSPGADSIHWGWKYLSVFQALNEEMLIRALLLTALARIISSQVLVSLTAASVFSLLHYALYQLGELDTTLSAPTLGTLFFFAMASNTFFFATKNIAIPYAIHVGWNINRFGQEWTHQSTGLRLQEAEGFNLIEGSNVVFVLAVILAATALIWKRLPLFSSIKIFV